MRREFDVGDVVRYIKTNEHGVVKFVGKTFFAPGVWIGVDLDNANGKHDGAVLSFVLPATVLPLNLNASSLSVGDFGCVQVFGHRYFLCRAHHGIFLRPGSLKLVEKGVEAVLTTIRGHSFPDRIPTTDLDVYGMTSSRVSRRTESSSQQVPPTQQSQPKGILVHKPSAVHAEAASSAVLSTRDRIQELEKMVMHQYEDCSSDGRE
jgi:CAP-Gly domain